MPILALMGSMASVCLGNSFAKTLFPVLGAAGTVTYRVTIGAAILLAFWRPWRLHLTRADAGRIAMYGVTLASMNLLFYLSLQMLSVGDKAVGQVDHLGAAYALAAGVCWALYILTGKNLGGLHAGQATSLGMTVGALFAIPFGVAQAGSALLTPSLILAGLGIGLLSSAIPYSLEMVALKHLPGKTFSVLLSLEPAIGALAGAIVLHEQLTGRQWTAILAIIAASAGCALTVRAPKSAHSE